MPLAGYVRTTPLEYFIVHGARPTGQCIGYYADYEISSSIIDDLGQRYTYVGAAPRKRNGRFDVDALQPREFILLPGLVYLREPSKASRLASLLGLD
jgi:hypothetical protein